MRHFSILNESGEVYKISAMNEINELQYLAMAGEDRVTLHGLWASPFSKPVELALKLKGIEYEYVEEDLMNKSALLLQYNPVHKKVPVLVHNGMPVVESLVILEYIDETWKDRGPKLLPGDPYERAKARFWANFLQQQMFPAMVSVVTTDGEAQARAIEQVHEKLKLLEEGIKGSFPGGPPAINGESMGLVDIIMIAMIPHKGHEEVLGVKFVDSEKYPVLSSWVESVVQQPMVRELTPPHEKIVDLLWFIREKALRSPAT